MRAVVYRGRASRPAGCAEAVGALLERHGLQVRFVGRRQLTPEVLASADVYAQPGGGTLAAGWRHLRGRRSVIRDYVAGGGRYLGFCLGGYLAGATPGFALLPGDTDRYAGSPGAATDDTGDLVLPVSWRGRPRRVFFQDGPLFLLDPGVVAGADVEILAHYPEGGVAALACPFGAGRVAVAGPHPEAGPDWFTDAGLPVPDPLPTDLGHDLIDEVLA
jgi:glutamine amidotransferase-like uncharacterized protein